jgi:hypothetical protein
VSARVHLRTARQAPWHHLHSRWSSHSHFRIVKAPNSALDRSRGGLSTTIHVRAGRHDKPLVLLVTAGERYDQAMFELLMQHGQSKRQGRGLPQRRPRRLVGNKGDSSRRIRAWLRQHDSRYSLPHKRTERHCGSFDRALDRERNHVKRLINRLQ